MARPGLATRDDLLGWPSIVAAGEFPRLIRRLVWETAPDAVRLGFPAGSGTSAGDWDGSVRTVTGNGFVPAGQSVWELSVEKSGITAKADGDYEKRTSTFRRLSHLRRRICRGDSAPVAGPPGVGGRETQRWAVERRTRLRRG